MTEHRRCLVTRSFPIWEIASNPVCSSSCNLAVSNLAVPASNFEVQIFKHEPKIFYLGCGPRVPTLICVQSCKRGLILPTYPLPPTICMANGQWFLMNQHTWHIWYTRHQDSKNVLVVRPHGSAYWQLVVQSFAVCGEPQALGRCVSDGDKERNKIHACVSKGTTCQGHKRR